MESFYLRYHARQHSAVVCNVSIEQFSNGVNNSALIISSFVLLFLVFEIVNFIL